MCPEDVRGDNGHHKPYYFQPMMPPLTRYSSPTDVQTLQSYTTEVFCDPVIIAADQTAKGLNLDDRAVTSIKP
jgi:hypothetical protein